MIVKFDELIMDIQRTGKRIRALQEEQNKLLKDFHLFFKTLLDNLNEVEGRQVQVKNVVVNRWNIKIYNDKGELLKEYMYDATIEDVILFFKHADTVVSAIKKYCEKAESEEKAKLETLQRLHPFIESLVIAKRLGVKGV